MVLPRWRFGFEDDGALGIFFFCVCSSINLRYHVLDFVPVCHLNTSTSYGQVVDSRRDFLKRLHSTKLAMSVCLQK